MLGFARSKAIGHVAMLLPLLLVTSCTYTAPSSETSSASGTGGAGAAGGAGGVGGAGEVGGSGGNASSSSSSGIPSEDCLNGVDDDANKSIDCADSACSDAYKCMPNGPVGGPWSEPFQAALLGWTELEPPCATKTAPKVYGLGPSPHGCTQCKCDLPGALCMGGQLTCYDGPNCSTIMSVLPVDQPGCVPIGVGSYLGCKQTQPVSFDASNTQCHVLSGGAVAVPAPFNQKLLRCDVPSNAGEGCANGEHCAPKRASEYAYTCIAASDQQACPSGWTAPKFTGYGTFDDSRACTPCTCNPEAATCMQNAFTGHSDDNCGGVASNLSTSNCVTLLNTQSIRYKQQPPMMLPHGCTTQPQGQLDIGDLTTICCRPAPP